MNAIAKANRLAIALGLLVTTSCTAASNPSTQSQQQFSQQLIKVDGSSTVFPITEAIAREFQKTQTDNVQVTVGVSGTGGGFEKFCAGESDISNASRPILTAEMAACNNAAELKKIWSPAAQGKITRWQQVRSSWPDRPLKLYGPGKDSGTFDYFTEATVGIARASRNDYTASEDDDVLVKGVSNDPNALGYFGFAYYEANLGKLKALAVNNGQVPVLPSRQTVEKAEYQPLSRPLFIYINAKSAQTKPALKEFVDFYIEKAPTLVSSVGYVPLPAEGYYIDNVHFNRGKVGTVFAGKTQINLRIGELLRKQASF